MLKNILVPTDFSECAQNAADFACQLAQVQGVGVALLHSAYVRFSEGGVLIDYTDKIQGISKEYLAEEKDRLLEKHSYLKEEKVETIFAIGDLDLEIKSLEKKAEYDLIVMGTKGRSGWEEILLGSETARVVENSTLPVLCIPSTAKYGSVNNVVFAAGLDERLSTEDDQFLKRFLTKNTKIHLYHNYADYLDMDVGKEQELLKEFHHHFKQYIDFQLEFNNNNIESIEEFAESIQADFLVVRKQHQSFLKEMFRVSVSKGLSYRAKMPLLVLR